MASKVLLPRPVNGLDTLYLTDTPVGNRSDNKRIADVQLVQLFLNDFFFTNPALFKKLPKPTTNPNAPGILMDGKVGRQTIEAINEFQREMKRRGPSGLIVDGRVSVPTGGLRVAGTTHVFTIIQLNTIFFNGPNSDENLPFNANLEDHPRVQRLPLLVADLRSRGPSS